MNVQIISTPVVNVTITSTISSFGSERKFQKDLTVADLKGKLELQTGVPAGYMNIDVYSKDDKKVFSLDNDNALLGSHHIDDGMRLHVIDKSGTEIGAFEDTSKVEKFELTEEEYTKRSDSVRAFKERMKLGRFAEKDPEELKRQEEEKKKIEEEELALISKMKVGDRCKVTVPGQPSRLGTVKYTGTTTFKPGQWVGVQYDEPLGKNDGSVQGKRYFECPAKYGGFVKPNQVEVGDFPEEDMFDDDDEM